MSVSVSAVPSGLEDYYKEISLLSEKNGKLAKTIEGKNYWTDSDFVHFEKDFHREFYQESHLTLDNWLFPEEAAFMENVRMYQAKLIQYGENFCRKCKNENKTDNIELVFRYREIKPEFNTPGRIINLLNLVLDITKRLRESLFICIDDTEQKFDIFKEQLYTSFRNLLISCHRFYFTCYGTEFYFTRHLYTDGMSLMMENFENQIRQWLPEVASTTIVKRNLVDRNGKVVPEEIREIKRSFLEHFNFQPLIDAIKKQLTWNKNALELMKHFDKIVNDSQNRTLRYIEAALNNEKPEKEAPCPETFTKTIRIDKFNCNNWYHQYLISGKKLTITPFTVKVSKELPDRGIVYEEFTLVAKRGSKTVAVQTLDSNKTTKCSKKFQLTISSEGDSNLDRFYLYSEDVDCFDDNFLVTMFVEIEYHDL